MAGNIKQNQLLLIKKRYETTGPGALNKVPARILVENLRSVIEPTAFLDKSVLEIGAGCSLYAPLFLSFGCSRLVANDLIAERLALNAIIDPRYTPVVGDFLTMRVDNSYFDVVFASLTFSFVVPMIDDFFSKIYCCLKPGGCLISFDPNYLCPLSICRRFTARGANPLRLFSPFSFKRRAIRHGFKVEKLVPLTTNHPKVTGNWLLGTSFMMKAVKPIAHQAGN